jgi:hypothetical protein
MALIQNMRNPNPRPAGISSRHIAASELNYIICPPRFQRGETQVTLDASDVQGHSRTRRLELQRIVDLDEPEACPHVKCRKVFRKVLVVSDPAKHPTRTFCACPYCLSKVTIAVKEVCQHYFGYLKKLPKSDSIPDECLICPKITQCLFNYHMG